MRAGNTSSYITERYGKRNFPKFRHVIAHHNFISKRPQNFQRKLTNRAKIIFFLYSKHSCIVVSLTRTILLSSDRLEIVYSKCLKTIQQIKKCCCGQHWFALPAILFEVCWFNLCLREVLNFC